MLAPSGGTAAGQHADTAPRRRVHAGHEGSGHADFRDGRTVDHAANGFDPHELVRDFDWGRTTPHRVRARAARVGARRARPRDRGRARACASRPGPTTAAIPGPTLRCREGERLRITFANASEHPHTIHFHGIHPSDMDGVPGQGAGQIEPGGKTVYEFDALPAGLHLYHCHVRPLAEHIAKGLYGAFIVDPKDGREDAEELVMVMNGFDTNFDRANEVYAANTIPFAYMNQPIEVPRGELIRALPRQRARVRPDQLVPPAREPVRLVPDRARRARRPSSPTR